MNNKSIEVHLHTNNTCNLKCLHCYNNSWRQSSTAVPSVGLLREILINFFQNYDATFHVEGGESFLREDFLVSLASLPSELLARIVITTNGTLRVKNPSIIRSLTQLAGLRVSVEGHTQEQHGKIRNSSLANILENAAYFQNLNVPVILRITLNHFNLDTLICEGIPSFSERGFKNIQIYEFQSVGEGSSRNEFCVGDKIERLFDDIIHSQRLDDTNVSIMLSRTRIPVVRAYSQRLSHAGAKVVFFDAEPGVSVHANGDVYLCPWDNQPTHAVVNIIKSGINETLGLLEKIDLTHTCSYCSALKIIL